VECGQDYFELGLRSYRQDEHREALEAFEKLLERDPEHIEGNYHLAMSLQKLGSLQQARTAFDRMLRIEPEHLAAN